MTEIYVSEETVEDMHSELAELLRRQRRVLRYEATSLTHSVRSLPAGAIWAKWRDTVPMLCLEIRALAGQADQWLRSDREP
jgi:hypothetical protein